jgi:HEAT repeat protein
MRGLPASPTEARGELARRILAEDVVPAADALALLDDPSSLAVAALALRCGASCVPGIAARLSASRTETRSAAAIVATAMREPALAEPLLTLAHGEGKPAAEAAVALLLLHRADDEARRRLEEAEGRLGLEEGLPGRISLARTLEGVAPAWGSFRGAGLWSCRWSRGDLPASSEGREEARETLVNAAIVLRAHPGRLATLSPERLGVAAEDLQQALACLGGAVNLSAELEELVGSTSVGLRPIIAPIILEHAQGDPAAPLLERLITDPDAAVRERVVASFRATMPGATRPFGVLVARLARDAAPEVRQAAVRVLPVGELDATPLLIAVLEDAQPQVRRAALENPELAGGHVPHRVAALADDPDVSVRMAAATALGDAAFPGAPAALRRLITSEETRAAAMRSLCRRGSREDLPRVIDAFRRLSSTERQTARFGFATARRLLGPDPTAAVRGVLADRDPEVARLGIVMLSISQLDETIEILEAAQRHRFPAVRRELAGTLSRLHMPDGQDTTATTRLRAVAQRLLQDPDPTVKCRALSTLSPGELTQDQLDQLTGENGASLDSLRDRWGCNSLPMMFD